MSGYLLDTNILSDLMRNPQGAVRFALNGIPSDQVFTSVVAAAEIRFGAAKRGSARLSRQAEIVLGGMTIQPFAEPGDQAYADLRCALEAVGRPIGAFDMLIAAHALATDAILVTDNTREFERVPGLKIENWLRG
ncbi:type II toxin-antitoxin system VapC family toxin [soil metagenome]